jgi:hypothetical protein
MTKSPQISRFLAGWLVCVTPFVVALLAVPALS